MEPFFQSARALLTDLQERRISATELLQAAYDRHKSVHSRINAIVRTDLDRALQEARAIDEARARGEQLGPLAGLPMTIKDGLDVQGMPAHSGNPELVERPTDCQDAEIVRRVRAAGAVIWGKSNVPYMLSDWQSFNDIYGTTNNPFDLSRTPGGSSGGAAAALASGITPLEIGSDIGGSLRHPANFCGVFSCKPTWGLFPLAGHVPPLPGRPAEVDMAVVGPMARSSDDLRLLFRVLSKKDPYTPTQSNKGIRVAVWTEFGDAPLDDEVGDTIESAAAILEKSGATRSDCPAPVDLRAMLAAYRDLLVAIVREDLKDIPPAWLLHTMRPVFLARQALGEDPLALSGYALALTAPSSQLARARRVRDAMKLKMQDFFETFDLIVCPVMACPAIPHTQESTMPNRRIIVNDQKVLYNSFLNWVALATVLHLPAVVVPVGLTRDGLPLGAQLIGPWGSEERLMDAAAEIEKATGGFRAPAL